MGLLVVVWAGSNSARLTSYTRFASCSRPSRTVLGVQGRLSLYVGQKEENVGEISEGGGSRDLRGGEWSAVKFSDNPSEDWI